MKTIKQFLAITSILIICSSGKIDRGYEALKIYDYFKAKKLFTKALKNNTVAASFGLSIIYGRNDNPFHSLDSAFKYINLADTSFLSLEQKEVEKLKKVSLDSSLISNWKDSIDIKVFRKAKRINSIEIYNDYLARHNNKKLNPIAIFKRDSIAFSKAKMINSSNSYSRFINIYPKSSFKNEATNRFEERLFYQVVESRSSYKYKQFIKEYQQSPYNLQAQDSVFTLLTRTNNIDSYENFIEQNPQNRNVNKAWRLIYKLFTADFKPEKIVDFRLSYSNYPFLNELKVDFELATKDFYPIKRSGKWGFVDQEGKQMIDFVYEFVEPFSDGVALAINNGLIGYINKSGEVVIPFQYSEGESFQSGLAVVAKGDQYGIISKTNSVILPFDYEEIGNLNSELILVANDVAYGYVNKEGKKIVPLTYKTAYDFNNGLAIVKKGNQYGVINQLGIEVIKCQYDWLEPYDKYGRSKAKLDGLYGIIDANGGVVLPFEYDAIGEFSDSLALISKSGKYGYINPEGEIKIPLELDYVLGATIWGNFKGGTVKYHLKGKYGIINKKGEKLFPAIFEDVGAYSGSSYVAVKKRGKWGYSNQNLQLMIPYQYLNAKTFKNSVGLVEKEEGWFFINLKEEVINEESYLDAEYINNEFFKIKSPTGWGLVDLSNVIQIESIFNSISFYMEDILIMKNKAGVSYYNLNTKSFIK